MMIGIGTDLCDIRRIERTLNRFARRFVDRIYTDAEKRRADRRPHRRAASYAMCFAAKEATAKALGTGFRQGVHPSAIGVVHLPGGKPTLELTGGAHVRLWKLIPPGYEPRLDVSLTDEYPLSHAMVVISAVPSVATHH